MTETRTGPTAEVVTEVAAIEVAATPPGGEDAGRSRVTEDLPVRRDVPMVSRVWRQEGFSIPTLPGEDTCALL